MVSSIHTGHISLDPLMGEKILVDSLPVPAELPNGTIMGNYSLKGPNGVRVIVKRHARILGGSHIQDTETAFTRCYLKSLPKRRIRREQLEARSLSRPPQYCKPADSVADVFYVDIESAYLSIYRRMSWRIEYLRNRYFSNDDDRMVYPFPNEWKSGRSYVITGALPGTIHTVYDHKLVVRPTVNPHENPPLVCAVWDVLSAIGRMAVDVYNARYFNLDGAVIPESKLYEYCDFLESLGLPYRTKWYGMARILNLGSWRIGDKQTKRFEPDGVAVLTDAIPVTLGEAEWILARFRRL